jgi:hypothetical protein
MMQRDWTHAEANTLILAHANPSVETAVINDQTISLYGTMKLCTPAVVVEATGQLGYPESDIVGIVVVEVPAKPQWCSIRNDVFSWTRTRFPFHTSPAKKLTLNQTPVITVIGNLPRLAEFHLR